MAKRELNNKLKKEIVFALISYLERRFNVSCELLKNSLKDKAVALDDYVSDLQETNRILDDLRRDDTRSREKFEYEDTVNLRRINIINQLSHRVIPSEENIKEILELLRYYLNNYPLPDDESLNETLFLRYAMMKLRRDKSAAIQEKAHKYFDYFSCNKDSCFSEYVSGRISFGYGSIVLITNQDDKVVFRVDEDKKIDVTYCPFDDYILFGDNLFLVKLNDTLVPLREVDGYYHDFLDTNRIYQTKDPERDDYVEIYKSLRDYLEESGLTRYNRQIYSIKEIKIITNLINNTDNYRDDSYKSRMVTKKNNGN